MSIRLYLARLTRKVSAVATIAVAFWSADPASAADVIAPSPAAAAGVSTYHGMPAGPGCATCEHGSTGNCTACGLARFGKGHLLHRQQTLHTVNLCPGACFGYFQTQWRKWDDVCPYPYQGGATNSAYPTNGSVISQPQPGPTLPAPRPSDPKMPEPKKPLDPVKPMNYTSPAKPQTAPMQPPPYGGNLLPKPQVSPQPIPLGSKFAP